MRLELRLWVAMEMTGKRPCEMNSSSNDRVFELDSFSKFTLKSPIINVGLDELFSSTLMILLSSLSDSVKFALGDL